MVRIEATRVFEPALLPSPRSLPSAPTPKPRVEIGSRPRQCQCGDVHVCDTAFSMPPTHLIFSYFTPFPSLLSLLAPKQHYTLLSVP